MTTENRLLTPLPGRNPTKEGTSSTIVLQTGLPLYSWRPSETQERACWGSLAVVIKQNRRGAGSCRGGRAVRSPWITLCSPPACRTPRTRPDILVCVRSSWDADGGPPEPRHLFGTQTSPLCSKRASVQGMGEPWNFIPARPAANGSRLHFAGPPTTQPQCPMLFGSNSMVRSCRMSQVLTGMTLNFFFTPASLATRLRWPLLCLRLHDGQFARKPGDFEAGDIPQRL